MAKFNHNRFAEIPAPTLNRNKFKRTFGHKTTLNEGELIPVHLDEVYAGDTLNGKTSMFLRMTTPITPVMDNLDLDLFAFFVPSRLVFKDYYKMFGEQENPQDSVNYVVPSIKFSDDNTTGFAERSLADYFGIPTKVKIPDVDMPIALPFRAYNLIWNEWFRDQNLQDSLPVPLDAMDDSEELYTIQRRNKKHDYFTSCLPFAQKGESVNLPIVGNANIDYNFSGNLNVLGTVDATGQGYYSSTNPSSKFSLVSDASKNITTSIVQVSNPILHAHSFAGSVSTSSMEDYFSNSYVDLTSASSITINNLREAISIQHILERRARAGTRDVEILQSTYGVSPTDSRLQRPELVAVSRGKLNITPVAQTSETSSTPLGDLAAIGTITATLNFSYSAVENGYFFILASPRADLTYWQGMPRMFSKKGFLDFMDPMRANLGEQPVLRKELLLTSDEEYNNEVFGYLPNFDDLRFGRSLLTGNFRPNAEDSLDIWHFAEEFSTDAGNEKDKPDLRPVLSSEFITQKSPIDRVLAVQDFPHFFGDVYSKISTYRVLPRYGIPGLRRI